VCAISAGSPKSGAAGHVGKGPSMEMRSTSGVKSPRDLDRGVAQPLVVLETPLRKSLVDRARALSRHAAAHAERLGFVGSRCSTAAADGDGLAAQGRNRAAARPIA
jgi:hypothetical protein